MKNINPKARKDREENLFILSVLSALSGSKGINV